MFFLVFSQCRLINGIKYILCYHSNEKLTERENYSQEENKSHGEAIIWPFSYVEVHTPFGHPRAHLRSVRRVRS